MDGFNSFQENGYCISEAYSFLLQYQWIFNFPVTHFIVNQVWNSFPMEWENILLNLSVEELNQIPFGYCDEKWPDSLKTFLKSSLKYSLPRTRQPDLKPTSITLEEKRGMSGKKVHEVTYMSAVVNKLAVETGSDVIIDIGSGLGYLGRILDKIYGHHVVGFESKQCHTNSAEKKLIDQGKMENLTFELQHTTSSLHEFDGLMQGIFKRCQGTYLGGIELKDLKVKSATRMTHSESDIDGACNIVTVSKDKTIENLSDNISQMETQQFRRNIKQGEHAVCDNASHPADSNAKEAACDDVTDENKDFLCDNIHHSSQQDNTECLALQAKDCRVHRMPDSDTCHVVEDNDTGQILEEKKLRDQKALMIGLHCCGDLTPTMMQYFHHFDYILALCCVSCCYHKMSYHDSDSKFNNFPLSKQLSAHDATLPEDIPRLNTFAMRLAAQETRSRWRQQSDADHSEHMRNVAYRAVLQLYMDTYRVNGLDKKFRKLVHRADMTSFNTYVESVCSRSNVDFDLEKLMQLYKDNEKYTKFIQPFTALQVILQPVLETLILKDRQLWLEEHGYHADIVPLFDDNISPRNLALVARK